MRSFMRIGCAEERLRNNDHARFCADPQSHLSPQVRTTEATEDTESTEKCWDRKRIPCFASVLSVFSVFSVFSVV
jgi:hypothetical protein